MHSYLLLALTLLMYSSIGSAQVIAQGAYYRSDLDDSLTIRRISVLPVSDNLDGIYARPIEATLIKHIKDNHHWDYREANYVGPLPSLEELEEDSSLVKKITAGSVADALVLARVTKGPKGVSLKINLFLVKDHQLLAQATSKNFNRFELAHLKDKAQELLREVLSKIPYDGLVLSRHNNRVTLNLGKKDGLKKNQVLSAVQILKVNRHPKFHFIINTEKEVLGKIKILKAEDTLSFGTIVTEKERGTIQKWAKVRDAQSVKYDVPNSLDETSRSRQDTRKKLNNDVAFGKNAVEWVPKKPPTFGMATLTLGLGSYNGSINLNSDGSKESTDSFYPNIGLEAELWVNPSWALDFYWSQAIASSDNPDSGGSPEKINHSLSNMGFFIAYNLLLKDSFFGPKIQLLGGAASYKDSVDDSTPRNFTSVTYSGPAIGIRGQMPVSRDGRWEAGIHYNFLFFTSLNESPVTSGSSSSNSVNDFKLFGNWKYTQNLLVTANLRFILTRASFDGDGTRSDDASSSSQKTTTLSGGVTYLF